MFFGEYRFTLDEKGRMTIPARFRGPLAEGMFVTRGFGKYLMAYDRDGFDELKERVKSLPIINEDAMNMRRRLFSSTADVVPDRQGRILIPQSLREFAGINGEVVIVGMDNYLEIWAAEDWDVVREQIEQDNLAAMAQLGI